MNKAKISSISLFTQEKTVTNIYLFLENSPRFGVEYPVETAENVRECGELIITIFEYVTERRGTKIYRKRK